MQIHKAVLSTALLVLLVGLPGLSRAADLDDDDDERTRTSRTRLRDLRDRHKSGPSEGFSDLQSEFGDIRDRTYRPPEKRSVSDRTSRFRGPTATKPTTSTRSTPSPNLPSRPPSISSARPPATRSKSASPVGVITGRKPAPGGPGGRPETIPTSRPILYLEPADMFVTQGEPFEVELRLSNPTQEMFDSMAVTLAYDPGKLEIIDADPSTSEHELSSAWESLAERYGWLADDPGLYSDRSDPETGEIEIRLRAPEGKTDVLEGTLGKFRFVPRASEGNASLSFVLQDEEGEEIRTFVREDEKDILGTPHRSDDGVLDASFRVSSEVEIAESPEQRGGDYKTRILFDPPLAEVDLGDVFDVDIVLENPAEVPFDTLSLVLGYNPRVLRVMDYDQNNRDKDGININDGDSVPLFPFTDRLANYVLPKQGVILYRAASPQEPISAEGVIATIRFVAIGPSDADGMALKVGFHPVNQSLNSGLYLRGRDVLAESESPNDGFRAFRVFIRRHEVTRSRNVWDELRRIY